MQNTPPQRFVCKFQTAGRSPVRRAVAGRSTPKPEPARAWRLIAPIAILLAAMTAASTTLAHAQPAPRTRILIVFSHASNAPGVVRFADQLKGVVRKQIPSAEIYEEFLDLDRFPDPARRPQLARGLTEKYRGFRPDAIVVEGASALQFVVDQLPGLFPGVPVVYGAVFEPIVDLSSLPSNVVGRRQPLPFAATYALAHALQRDAEHVVVVGGVADSLIGVEARRQITPLLNGVRLTLYQDWSYEELLDSLRRLSPRTFVVLSEFTKDRRGRTFIPAELTATLSHVASVPMYGIARNWIGDGIVGGSVMNFSEDGARVGRIALRVLARKPNEPMPASEVAAIAMVVDWRELERWGLSEARLPPGTEVLFREPTPWQRYRAVVLLTCGVIAAESLLIGLLLLERRRRKRAQVALDEQAAYEQVIANLKADAAEHSLDNGLRRLDDALARLAIYARATAAMLVQRPETRLEPPARILWRKDADATHDDAALSTASLAAAPDSARLEIPLVADGSSVGVLTLVNDGGWTPVLVRRIEAASEIIAAAIASSRVARALEEVKDQVEHMARVALIGELAATMSHELRQPLSAIRANAEAGALLLARSSQDQCEARDIFHDIVADDARAVEVIEGVRRLLRKDDQVAAPVDLNEICREAVRLLNYDARLRHTRLELSLAQTLPSVIGHRIQLQQAVLNLAINGLEAASTSKTERFVVVETELCVDEDEVAVSVRDSGPGIPDDVEPHLFESFFSTKAGGLGLGLVIVRSIAERHHGCVRAENHASGGAVFRMQLPIIDGPSPRVVD